MNKIISIDGLDGSGKGTQASLLQKYLIGQNKNAHLLSFPVYDNVSSTFVRMYLGGALGASPSDTNAYAASTFYAMDRYVSYRTDWGKLCCDDAYLVFNRYTTANAVHQLSKLERGEWDSFLNWLWDFEFAKLSLPVPDLIFYLIVHPDISMKLVDKRSTQTGQKKDIHELDSEYMHRSYEAGLYAAEKLGWTKINCCNRHGIRSIEDIQNELQDHLKRKFDLQ